MTLKELTTRANALIPLLSKTLPGVRTCRRVARVEAMPPLGGRSQLAYALTLNDKTPHIELQIHVLEFCDVLRKNLSADEHLLFKHRGFWIIGPNYELVFSIEGFSNNSSQCIHMDDQATATNDLNYGLAAGEPQIEPLYRWAVAKAGARASSMHYWYHRSAIARRAGMPLMMKKYPNPTDRFVASVKLECLFDKLDIGFCYDPINENFASAFVFYPHSQRHDYPRADKIYIESKLFSVIESVFNNHVPNFDRYAVANEIDEPTCRKIIGDLKTIAWHLMHDVRAAAIREFVNNFNLSTMLKQELSCPRDAESRFTFLVNHRKRINGFLQFLIDWLDEFWIYCDQNDHIILQGV